MATQIKAKIFLALHVHIAPNIEATQKSPFKSDVLKFRSSGFFWPLPNEHDLSVLSAYSA